MFVSNIKLTFVLSSPIGCYLDNINIFVNDPDVCCCYFEVPTSLIIQNEEGIVACGPVNNQH